VYAQHLSGVCPATIACVLWILLLASVTDVAQPSVPKLPQFDEYRVTRVFSGKPASPKLVRPSDRLYRTRIREGAAAGPNFAGHFTIAEWGCGSSCVSIALVNAETGEVYRGPFGVLGSGRPLNYADGDDQLLSYNLNSRLMKVRGCPEDRNCAEYFYEWTGKQFRLIQKITAK
jgi:hypothetical protein